MTRQSPSPSLLLRWTEFVRLSLRDDDTDYTVGPVGRALGLLAIPMMLEMSMEAVFAVVDIAFVSRLGTDAIAAVGITEALVTVLYAVAIGLGMGITAMVSRRVGAKNVDEAASVTGQALWLGAILSIIIGAIGIIFAEDMLRLIGASESVIDTGTGYTAVLLGGSFSILYIFILNAAFRGAGDAAVALRSLWIANGLNIILDPCFIFGLGPFPEMGVTGAAVATTIGRGTGVLYQLWYLLDGRGRLKFHLRHMRIVPDLIKRMLKISIGGVGQFLIATSSWIIVMRIIALYGSNAIAAYTIALRMLEFVWLPAWGIGNAAATLVGQNLGAEKADRAERSAWHAVRFNVLFMTLVGSVILIAAPVITGWFTDDPEVLRYGTICLRMLSIGLPLYAIGMILTQALNGAGDTFTPSAMNLICFWLIQIPLAYWLATQFGAGPNGVFAAIVISESLLSLLAITVFRNGRWKHQTA
jgi:putative MATE family efflux protein